MENGNGCLTGHSGGFEFPCLIDVKVFLKACGHGDSLVRALLLEKLGESEILSISCKQSRNGNYHSFTCRVWMVSQVRMNRLYEHLGSQEQVLFVL